MIIRNLLPFTLVACTSQAKWEEVPLILHNEDTMQGEDASEKVDDMLEDSADAADESFAAEDEIIEINASEGSIKVDDPSVTETVTFAGIVVLALGVGWFIWKKKTNRQ